MAESHGAAYSGGMNKARNYDIATTNIAGLGTNLEKAVRQAAGETEKAWENAGKEVGVKVWRIEQFKVVEWPKKRYGEFYSGDSYVLLHTYHKHGKSGAIIWDIHFWIGNGSSQDEYGTAAYKTVELDDVLGGHATQYREIQGSESKAFRKLFKKIVILEGGVDSGFNEVKPIEYRARLLHVKGKLNVLVREVPIKPEYINHGDSFIFDQGLRVYVWHGKDAGAMEKTKAASAAQAIDDSRGGKCQRLVYEDGGEDAEWWKALNITASSIRSTEEGGADDQVAVSGSKRLLKLSDQDGSLKMTVIAEGDAINRRLLTSSDVFILDDGFEVMVWVGLEASRQERKQALNHAAQYLKDFGRPLETTISKVLEGGENEIFEAAFEVGVLTGSTEEAIRAAQRSGAAAGSVSATYGGSGGPGVATDFDALYAQQGVDPADWKGRSKGQSAYAQELQAGGHGAYSQASGWVSGQTAEQRAARDERVAELEQQYADGKSRPIWASTGGGLTAGPSPTLKAAESFNAGADAEALKKAIKGLGTNDKKLIEILAHRNQAQRLQIAECYARELKRDLIKDIKADTSQEFEDALTALVRSPSERTAYFLHKATKGVGTKNGLLIECLCTKEGWELPLIKKAFTELYGENLDEVIDQDTSFHFKQLLLAIVEGKRIDSRGEPDLELAKKDAEKLYAAGEKRFGTDEAKLIEVFSKRSYPQLRAAAEYYPQVSKKSTPLRDAIMSETSGHFQNLLVSILDYATDSAAFYAERLYKSMTGVGTRDYSLISIIVDRCEVDMGHIKIKFAEKYGKTLKDYIIGDTSGNYRKVLLALIGEE